MKKTAELKGRSQRRGPKVMVERRWYEWDLDMVNTYLSWVYLLFGTF